MPGISPYRCPICLSVAAHEKEVSSSRVDKNPGRLFRAALAAADDVLDRAALTKSMLSSVGEALEGARTRPEVLQ
jgi:hypothetical protein